MMATREDLLSEYGRFYGEQRFAVAFTAGIKGEAAKRVTTKGWDTTAQLQNGDFAAGLVAASGKSRNPVIVVRPSGLIVLECDTETDLTRIVDLGLPETITVRSSAPYKRHFYFRPPPELEVVPFVAFRFESGKLTADTGRYFVAPPALHPSGAVYDFVDGHGPADIEIATLPEAIYKTLAQQAQRESGELREQIAIDPEAKIRAGNRRDLIFRYACMLRRWGLSRDEISAQAHRFNEQRCDPPVDHALVEVQVDGAMKKKGDQELAATNGHLTLEPTEVVRVVTLTDFISRTEDVAEPFMGTADDALLPSDGLLLMYGDGGAGKTTLSIDALAHIASGTDWLGVAIPKPLRVLLIENEGPRGPFRRRLAAKVNGWQGEAFAGNVHTLEEPWTQFTLKESRYRQSLAAEVDRTQTDIVIVGPLASLGAKGTGTPDDVNEFTAWISDLRDHAERPFALWIVHHENKAGDVSGAWERVPDTLVHVSAQGNGHTRVAWRKVRWSSTLHNTSVQLRWTDNSGFELEEKAERDYKQEILDAYEKENDWRTVNEVRYLIRANPDRVREALTELINTDALEFKIGPPGRKKDARCYRLRTDSEGASHPESPTLFEGGSGGADSLTPPISGVKRASQITSHPSTDSTPAESPDEFLAAPEERDDEWPNDGIPF